MWKFSGLFRCEKFQAYLGVKISGLKFSGVKFFNPPCLAQFQPNLHVKILAWSHVKISGLKQVWFTCENRCDRFGTGNEPLSGKLCPISNCYFLFLPLCTWVDSVTRLGNLTEHHGMSYKPWNIYDYLYYTFLDSIQMKKCVFKTKFNIPFFFVQYIQWWFVNPDTFVPSQYFQINEFSGLLNRPSVQKRKSVPALFVRISEISGLSDPGLTNHHCICLSLNCLGYNNKQQPMNNWSHNCHSNRFPFAWLNPRERLFVKKIVWFYFIERTIALVLGTIYTLHVL